MKRTLQTSFVANIHALASKHIKSTIIIEKSICAPQLRFPRWSSFQQAKAQFGTITQVSQDKFPADFQDHSTPPFEIRVTDFKVFCHSKKSHWLWLIFLLSIYLQTTGWWNSLVPRGVEPSLAAEEDLGEKLDQHSCISLNAETISMLVRAHFCAVILHIQTLSLALCCGSINPHIKTISYGLITTVSIHAKTKQKNASSTR